MLYTCNDNALSFTALSASFIFFEHTSDLKITEFKIYFHTFAINITLELNFLKKGKKLAYFSPCFLVVFFLHFVEFGACSLSGTACTTW